jgi:hypothetical protein
LRIGPCDVAVSRRLQAATEPSGLLVLLLMFSPQKL